MTFHRSTPTSFTISRRAALAGGLAAVASARFGSHGVAQTPAPDSGTRFAERIGRLLGAVPARELDDRAPLAFYYADLAGQLASVGVERPDPSAQAMELPGPFFEAAVALPLASRAFQSARDPEWLATFGFNPFAVGQALELPSPLQTISIFRGGFERARVEAALEASGYRMVLQETGGDYWTVGDEVDLESTVGRLGLGTMNSAFATDEMLVFTQREADLQAVTQAMGGYAPSMIEQMLWSRMVSQFADDTVGMIPLAPGILPNAPGRAGATPAATPVVSTPEIQYLAFGVRAGSRAAPMSFVGEGTPEATPAAGGASIPARVEARLRYGSESTARREATAIPERWTTMDSLLTQVPYADLMAIDGARVSSSDPLLVAVDFIARSPNVWIQLVHNRDLAPLVPAVG